MSSKRYRRQVVAAQAASGQPKKSTDVTNLPPDTLIHIQFYLSPQEILIFRKCCRSFYGASRERTVWMHALRRVCDEHSVFAPTFPTNAMSIDELEYASTSDYRFASRLWKELHADGPLLPIATRILRSNPGNHPFVGSLLLPGGRFLATQASGNLVQLWDLGYSPDMLISYRPLASVAVDVDDRVHDMLAQPTPDGLGIILLVVSTPFGGVDLNLYEIYPLVANPAFRQIGQLQRAWPNLDAYAMASNILVSHGNDQTVLWNYITDELVTWEVAGTVNDIIITKDNIVILKESELAVYESPLLTSSQLNTLAPPQSPLLRLICPLDNPSISSSLWQPSKVSRPGRPYHFDMIGDHTEDDTPTIIRYATRTLPLSPLTEGMPRAIPVPVDSLDGDTMIFELRRIQAFELAGRSRLLCWTEGALLKAHASVLPAHGRVGSGVLPKKGVLWRWPVSEDDAVGFSLCPMAGRLCVLSWEGEIRVLDFVQPPGL